MTIKAAGSIERVLNLGALALGKQRTVSNIHLKW